jgi:hypothetical protein
VEAAFTEVTSLFSVSVKALVTHGGQLDGTVVKPHGKEALQLKEKF